MDVPIARERASVTEIQAAIADPPSYSAVRATLRMMAEKAISGMNSRGPVTSTCRKSRLRAPKRSALRHMPDTLFNGSPEQVMAALLDARPSPAELDRIAPR